MRLAQCFFLFFAVTCAAPVFSGGLNDLFDDVVSANGHGNRELKSQQRRGWSLGNSTVRIKTYNPRVIAVRAPYLNAGCSGIDAFAGSLSLIKKEELVQAGRAIVAGAAMYAFQIAFDQLCPDCNAAMSELAKRLESYNQLLKGDCKDWAQRAGKLVGTESSTEKTDAVISKARVNNALSVFPDFATAWDRSSADRDPDQAKQTMGNSPEVKIDYNLVVSSFTRAGLNEWNFLMGSSRDTSQLLQSLLGTRVATTDPSAPSEPGKSKYKYTTIPHTLSIKDFFDSPQGGSANTIRINRCSKPVNEDPECLSVDPGVEPPASMNFTPFKTRIVGILCGTGENSLSSLIRAKRDITDDQAGVLMLLEGGAYVQLLTNPNVRAGSSDDACQSVATLAAYSLINKLAHDISRVVDQLILSDAAAESGFVPDLEKRIAILHREIEELTADRESHLKHFNTMLQLYQAFSPKG